MKILKPAQLLELLAPDPALVDAALERFESLTPTLYRKPGVCKEAVAEGWTIPVTISVENVPAYFVTYRKTIDGGLWIDIAQRLGANHHPLETCFAGIELLAIRERCSYIRFATARAGLARAGQRIGYVPESVVMTKGVAV